MRVLQVQRAGQVDRAELVRARDRHAAQHRAAGVGVAAVERTAGPGGAEGDEVRHAVAVGHDAEAAAVVGPVQAQLQVAALLGLQAGIAVFGKALIERGHAEGRADRAGHAPAGREAVAVGHATGGLAAKLAVAVVPQVDLQRVRPARVAVSERDGVLVPALVDGVVGQVVLAPLQRGGDQVAALAPLVLQQHVAQRGLGEVGRRLGLVALLRFADRQAGAELLGPLAAPARAQGAQAAVGHVVQIGREAVVAALDVAGGGAEVDAVVGVELHAQTAAGGGLAVAVEIGVGVGPAVETAAQVARRAQRVVHRAVLAGKAGLQLAGAAAAHAQAHVGAEGAVALFGEDLHHAGDGVGAVHRRGRAAHDLDAFHLAERDGLPRRAAGGLGVNAHAVDVDGGEAVLGTAHEQAGGGAGAAVARQLQARLPLQQVGDGDGAAVADLLLVEQGDVGQHVGQRLSHAVGGDDGVGQAGRGQLGHGDGAVWRRGIGGGLGVGATGGGERAGERDAARGRGKALLGMEHDESTINNMPLPASPPAYGATWPRARPPLAAGA